MKPLNLKKLLPFVVLTGNYLTSSFSSFAQCTLTAPAIGSCSGGSGSAHNNTNVNVGQTYWYSGNGTLANINMAGGTLRVCGTLTLTSLDFNSGTIIVENSGRVTINGSSELLLSGLCFIVNRGSLTINPNVQLRNFFNVIWNDNAAAVLNVNGTLNLNSGTSYIINKGILKATNLLIQSNADENSVCMRDNAIMNVGALLNNASNAFSYSGAGSPGCVSIGGNYTLNRPFTSSSSITVCKTAGAATGGSENWGSASVTTGCSGCSIALPLHMDGLSAVKQNGNIKLQWSTADNSTGRENFDIEKSTDGLHFNIIGHVQAQQGKSNYIFYDGDIAAAVQYYRIRLSGQGIGTTYSAIAILRTSSNVQISMYPNPVPYDHALTVSVTAAVAENMQLLLTDAAGKIIMQKKHSLNAGSNAINCNLNGIPAGVYFMRIESMSLGSVNKLITVTKN
jgi:hypothetical protein